MSKEIIINTRGAYLHVKDEMFEIRFKNQTTQAEEKHTVSPKKITSIILSPSTALSTDSIHLAVKNHIDIVYVDDAGHPMGRFWHTSLGSTSRIVKQQTRASLDARSIPWVKKWIGQKLTHQREFIQDLKKHRAHQHDFLNARIEQMEAMSLQTAALNGETMKAIADTLRGYEGMAGRAYWEAISHALPTEHQFAARTRQPALDVFNACLNYGYGILYRRVERALIVAGLQPHIGFFHRDDYNYRSMVYDFIESYRIWVEMPIFKLFSGKKIFQLHSQSVPNGVGLTKEGKQLIADTMLQYLDTETIKYKGRNQTRDNSLRLDAHEFANELLEN